MALQYTLIRHMDRTKAERHLMTVNYNFCIYLLI